MDPLVPVFVRLRTSTVQKLKEAREHSNHRSLASFVDHLLRRHFEIEDPQRRDSIQALTRAAGEIK